MYKAYLRATALTSVVLCGLGLAAGCQGVEPEAPPDDVEQAASPLAGAIGVTLWANSLVKICWTNAGLAVEKERIRTAIESSWGDNSGLTFEWPSSANTTCPRSGEFVAAEYLPVFVVSDNDFGGVCAFGMGGRQGKSACGGVMQCQCVIHTDNDVWSGLPYGAIHEVGHGLGFIHEHKRTDRPGDLETTCNDENADPNKWTQNGNYTLETAFLPTPYDGGSLMNYCFDPDNDGVRGDSRVDVGLQYPEISPFDKLGIEMFYPYTLNRQPVPANGIGDASGTNFIVRSDVQTTLQTDWTARGALPSFFQNPAWRWRFGASLELQEQFSTSLTPAVAISGSKVVEVQVEDVLGRLHGWTRTTLRGDNAQFTGVVTTASNYLLM